ncbi:ABC transporter substrate-binding protein [Curvibacter sp. APW13]|uniref:ABC transporter substrate-binding protein n=1 Tax=Curvibacter sp. APW13 TaxID=3077236 RepID=UPI0028DE2147|nr:ABC transporter substrate-binding protein [Curvibacter sp. APW13]MDT8989246.1 ABC transporter substrate-binding protein [Curvibacter sp. APW13]
MRTMKFFRPMLVLILACVQASAAWSFSVTFINPGKSDEVYWLTVTRAMEAAAKGLGIKLDVIYVERQTLRAIDQATQIAARPAAARPDYVIIANEGGTGPEMLRILDGAGIKTFMAFSGIIQPAERAVTGAPREKYKNWLGSLEPQAEEAGQLTMQELLRIGRARKLQAPDGKLHVLAISGDRATTTSVKRSEAMRKVVAAAPDAVIDQEVFGEFRRDKAAEQSEWLFKRFPNAKLVWAANDLMAFGAMQSLEASGGVPGKDAIFSGINTSREAMEAIRSGRMDALAGGHFILGAWALVMLYDFHNGRDFAGEGLEMSQPMFALFSPDKARLFLDRYGEGRFDSVDFRKFSKVVNPALKRYNFSFEQLIR